MDASGASPENSAAVASEASFGSFTASGEFKTYVSSEEARERRRQHEEAEQIAAELAEAEREAHRAAVQKQRAQQKARRRAAERAEARANPPAPAADISLSTATAHRQLAALLGDQRIELEREATYDTEVYTVTRRYGGALGDGEDDEEAVVAKRYSVDAGCRVAATLRLLGSRGLPVPALASPRAQLWRRGWLLVELANGERLSDVRASLSLTELIDFYCSFGCTLGTLHQISEHDARAAGLQVARSPPWATLHLDWIRERLAILDGTPEFGTVVDAVEAWFLERHADPALWTSPPLSSEEEGEEAHSTHRRPHPEPEPESELVKPRCCLLHLDLNQTNIFIDRDARAVSAIIDWDEVCFGHTEEELMRTECAHFTFDGSDDDCRLRAAFFDGYTSVTPLDEGYEQRRPLYYLSRLLVHAGCMIELDGYGREEDRANARCEIERVLAGQPLDYRGNTLPWIGRLATRSCQ